MKRNNRLARTLKVIMIVAMFAAAASTFNDLPEQIPVHWNFAGEPDDFASKGLGAFLIPGITLVLTLLMPLLAYIDPRRKNYEKFNEAWEGIQTTIVAFMVYIYFAQLYISLNDIESRLMTPLMVGGLAFMLILMGHFIRRIKSNFFVGIRTPWTLDDPVVWEKTHELGGKIFMATGALLIVPIFQTDYFLPIIIIGMIMLTIVPIVYSYLLFRKRHP